MSDTAPVADGLTHSLDPLVIRLQRIQGGLSTAVIATGLLVALAISIVRSGDEPAWIKALLWFTLVALLTWQSYRWPSLAYQHTSYRVDGQGIEIRKGVYWRVVINVPRSRVQHIDVSQGPIERRFGLATLIVYTAGTDHAKVELAGLAHGRALLVREHLLPSGSTDAV